MKYIVALLALALCIQADLVYKAGVSFNSNVNVTLAGGSDDRFNYHKLSTGSVSIPGFDVFWYKNLDVTGTKTSNGTTVTADGVFGAGYVGPSVPPSSFACYFDVIGNVGLSSDLSAFAASASASLSLVGKVYTLLEEIDTTGKVVNSINFAQLPPFLSTDGVWTSNGFTTVDSDRGLQYVTFKTTYSGATVAITYAVSSVLGKLNNGGATITPTSLESFFEVDGYKYAAATNSLRLTIYVGHLSAHASVAGSGTIVAGSGSDQIYIRVDSSALINGASTAVQVTGIASNANSNVGDFPEKTLKGFLSGHASLQAEVRKIQVVFPANAASLTYDPAIGFGAPNAGSFLAPSVLVFLAAALLALFF